MVRPARHLRNLLAAVLTTLPALAAAAPAEQARWRAEAARVTITRDEWGIAHVRGHSDADAVFGAIYAQAEDDFGRIEANYLTALGRTAEVEGEAAIWQDLRQHLFVEAADLPARYRASPGWLRALMDAWADGLNFYLAKHPAVHPRVLTRFEPWMALSFTEGSIGGDIERVPLSELRAFYDGNAPKVVLDDRAILREPRGSNGMAIAPANTAAHHALLLINPHTSFYFRSELQMTSDAGLDAYGASTWGQFFIYQGFNPKIGWMHTSSGVDNVDEFAETIVRDQEGLRYRYGTALRPVTIASVAIAYRKPDESMGKRLFTVYRTHHGPIVAARGGKWIAEALMVRPVAALKQSWLRTKTTDLASYLKVASGQANSSNDTIFADAKGEIAYLHPQFVPVRDDRFDYTRPVNGADPATDWKGLHPLATLPRAIDPPVGWVRNTNDWPWSAAGSDSPKAADFPRYMDQVGENARGLHADLLLDHRRDWTPEQLIAAAYDPYLPAFAALLPRLVAGYDALPAGDPRRRPLAGPIALLRGWDHRWQASSTATSLAVFWGDTLRAEMSSFIAGEYSDAPRAIADHVPIAAQLDALGTAAARLTRDFGSWRVPWGEINRFQRLDDAIDPYFDDAQPSIAVPFPSAQWGSLASFGAKAYPNTRRYYGTSGNSFVAVVEFGPRVRAWAVMAGGESGDPASGHFADQAVRYAAGALRPIHFYPDELARHVSRRYSPGS